MRKTLVAALVTATSATAVLVAGPATTATATSSYCNQTRPSTSILFYNGDSGSAATGTLSAGRWQQKAEFDLPTGYSHAAASRDSLVLYNQDTGAAEVGTLKDGRYHRTQSYDTFSTGWTFIEASGDSVLFYNADSGYGVTGTLRGGVYRELHTYANFSKGWGTMAASCDTLIAAAGHDSGGSAWSNVGYGTLTGGVYRDKGAISRTDSLEDLTATKDSALSLSRSGDELEFRVSKAVNGSGIRFNEIGTSGIWEKVGRTSDSLFFYKDDGTAWISTLVNGHYRNVGSLAEVSSGWTLIEGGV